MSSDKIEELVNRQTRILLDYLISNIRQQAGHQEFSWNDTIEYLVIKLNGMREDE